jgi:hypothetical protein
MEEREFILEQGAAGGAHRPPQRPPYLQQPPAQALPRPSQLYRELPGYSNNIFYLYLFILSSNMFLQFCEIYNTTMCWRRVDQRTVQTCIPPCWGACILKLLQAANSVSVTDPSSGCSVIMKMGTASVEPDPVREEVSQ